MMKTLIHIFFLCAAQSVYTAPRFDVVDYVGPQKSHMYTEEELSDVSCSTDLAMSTDSNTHVRFGSGDYFGNGEVFVTILDPGGVCVDEWTLNVGEFEHEAVFPRRYRILVSVKDGVSIPAVELRFGPDWWGIDVGRGGTASIFFCTFKEAGRW